MGGLSPASARTSSRICGGYGARTYTIRRRARERDPELVQKRVQETHEGLAVGNLANIRRAQAESPEQILRIEDGD